MLKVIPKTISVITLSLFINAYISAELKEVTLFHTNDIESVYDPIEAIWRDDIELIGGMPYLATLIKQERAKQGISFLFDAGDIYTGALSKKSLGKLPFDLYSAMGYDAVNIGNHEFEYGWQSLVETKPRARFPVLNANIVHKESGTLIAQPYTILEQDGVRIGVVGVMGSDAFHNASAKFHRAELTIKDPIISAQYWIDKIRAEVDMVVVLTHQNKTAPMQTNKEADPSVQRGFDEDYKMAGLLRGADIIFGGHSDNGLLKPVTHPKTGVVIGITFGQGMHLGYTKFNVNTETDEVALIEGKLIPVNAGTLPRDPKTYELIQAQRELYPALNEQAATIEAAAMRRYNKESTIGNLLTDIMREASGSDITMLNSGAIRADLYSGPVTREHIINVYPFIDKITVVELNGQQLKQLLEYSCTLPYGIGQFSGLTLTYDSTQPEMQRIISVEVGGEKLKESKKYTVATSSFVAAGGDGFEVFTQGRVVADELVLGDALFEGFRKRGAIELPALGRQIDLSSD